MTDLLEIANDALREMYEEAEPGLDFDDVRENPDEYPDDWYSEHVLDGERQKEIVRKHCEKHDLSSRESAQVSITAILNYGPANPEPNGKRAAPSSS